MKLFKITVQIITHISMFCFILFSLYPCCTPSSPFQTCLDWDIVWMLVILLLTDYLKPACQVIGG